jgi:hypothetical protein
VYPDEPSIRSECDPGMTCLKQTRVRGERMQLRLVYHRRQVKKKPAG